MRKPLVPLVLLFVAVVATSCTTTHWVNTGGYWLESVNTPDHIVNPFLTENGVYVDDSVTIKLELWDDGFDLNLKNLGKEDLIVRWDGCSYKDEMGTTHEIMHMKNQYMKVGSTVKGGDTYNDFLAPSDALEEDNEFDDELIPLWRIHSYKTKAAAEAARPDSSSLNVTLALQRGGTIDDYVFTFAGDDYRTSKVEIPDVGKIFFVWDLTLVLIMSVSALIALII